MGNSVSYLSLAMLKSAFKKLLLCLMALLIILNFSYPTFADQKSDQAYAAWKARQQAQDQRLKQEKSDQYYLSTPQIHEKRQSKSKDSVYASQGMSGKISLNSANQQQLQQLNGVGAKKAQAIIDYRNQSGGFKTIEELQRVKGVGPKLLEKNKALLSL